MSSYVVPSWADNAPLPVSQPNDFEVINGESGKLVHRASSADENAVQTLTESSWKAFQSWKKSSLAVRRDLLLRFADTLEKRADEIIRSTIDEISCDQMFAKFTFMAGLSKIRETASYVLSIYGHMVPGLEDPSIHGFVFREPVGPVLLIPPWVFL